MGSSITGVSLFISSLGVSVLHAVKTDADIKAASNKEKSLLLFILISFPLPINGTNYGEFYTEKDVYSEATVKQVYLNKGTNTVSITKSFLVSYSPSNSTGNSVNFLNSNDVLEL